MVACIDKHGHVVLVIKRTQLRTTYIATSKTKRKLQVTDNRTFNSQYLIVANDPVTVATRWLAAPIKMTQEVRKRLEMIIGMKKNVVVGKYEDAAEAPVGVELISDVADLAGRSLKSLTALVKKLTGEDAKFETVEEASVTAWNAVSAYEVPVKTPKVRQKKDPSELQARAIKGELSGASIITVIVEANPKREGSKGAKAFALYQNGMTVDEFVAAGGSRADVRWDAAHDYISIKHVEEPVVEKAVKEKAVKEKAVKEKAVKEKAVKEKAKKKKEDAE